MNPIVSVILPCYNGEAFIADAIESALAQTYSAVEVIVVDDGSTDRSWERIKSYGDRIRAVTGPNAGGCSARNRGIEMASGEWIQFLDADDLLYPGKLMKQMPLALANPDAPTYCDHVCREMDSTEAAGLRSLPVVVNDPFLFVLRHRTLHTMGPIYRRQWLSAVGGFRPGLRASQEFELNLRLALRVWGSENAFVHLPKALFEVRRLPNSVSSNPARTFAACVDALEELAAQMLEADPQNQARRRELAIYSARAGRQCLRGRQTEAGIRLVALADRLDQRAAEAAAWGTASRWLKRALGCRAAERIASWRTKRVPIIGGVSV